MSRYIFTQRQFRLLCWFAILFIGMLFVRPVDAQTDTILQLEVDGVVSGVLSNYFARAVEEAEERRARAILIELNTPGGDVNATLDIVTIFQNSAVPIIVYVSPSGGQAASAGSIITLAGHAAVMAPNTVMGAASPISGDGSDIGETSYRKLVNDLKATMRTLTDRRGPEAVETAEAMIEDAIAVTDQEALEIGLIDGVADDVDEALAIVDGLPVVLNNEPATLRTAGAVLVPFSVSFIENVLFFLTNPLLIGSLLFIGVQAIIVEINSPGLGVPGFVGILCIALALYGAGQLPVNGLGFILIGAGVVLFILEIGAGTGALAVAGTVALIAGLLVLFNSPGSPEFARISVAGAVGLGLSFGGFFAFLVFKVFATKNVQVTTGSEGLLGRSGTVRKNMVAAGDGGGYRGTVLVNGEIWNALSSQPAAKGTRVIVTGRDGFTLTVEATQVLEQPHEVNQAARRAGSGR